MTCKRRNQGGQVPNPFRTYSSHIYPRTMAEVLDWARYLWEKDSKYRTAVEKAVTYFVSDIRVVQEGGGARSDADEVSDFTDLLKDDYDMLTQVVDFGRELAAMGNVFVSAERIFSRELLCPTEGCAWEMRLSSLRKGRDYDWDGRHVTGTCPRCGRKVEWIMKDVKAQDSRGRRIRLRFRPAEDMRLQFNRLTGTCRYIYRLPDDVADGIRRGDPVYLEDTPRVFIDAAVSGERYIEFPPESFFADRTSTLASMDSLLKGWGLPLMMRAFDNLVNLQQLNKFNEAVVSDYLLPLRILSPAPQNLRAGIDDPNRMPMSGAAFRSCMASALKGRAVNPTQWVISPVPVQEQQVGGNREVVPYQLMEWETTQTLSDMGIPQEFRQTDFQTVSSTMGLRMFERLWVHFAKSLNRFVHWAGDIVARAHGFESMSCSLDMTSFVEDDMNKQVLIQLMQGQMIAKAPVLSRLGVDFEDDLKQRVKEQQTEERAMREQQEDLQNAEMLRSALPPAAAPGMGQAQMNIEMLQQQAAAEAQGGAPAQPGAPAGPAPAGAPAPAGEGAMPAMPFSRSASGSASIEAMFQQGQELAQQLLQLPPAERRRQLVQLKTQDPALHATVKQMLADLKQGIASDAVAQATSGQGM